MPVIVVARVESVHNPLAAEEVNGETSISLGQVHLTYILEVEFPSCKALRANAIRSFFETDSGSVQLPSLACGWHGQSACLRRGFLQLLFLAAVPGRDRWQYFLI
jgi:hypothetical protein